MTYNPVVFKSFHDMAVEDAPGVCRALEEVFPSAHRYADIGAGSGAFASELKRRGREVVACEHGLFGRLFARRQGVDCRPFDLHRVPPSDLGREADIAYCFEVAEHVGPDLSSRLVEFVASRAPVVVFTAARPGQGGIGHVNEQPADYWIERFAGCGMRARGDLGERLMGAMRAAGVSRPWFAEHVLVFERSRAE